MARFTTLYSGSSGNSALVEENGRYLLVDMGKSCRMTQNALKGLGLRTWAASLSPTSIRTM